MVHGQGSCIAGADSRWRARVPGASVEERHRICRQQRSSAGKSLGIASTLQCGVNTYDRT